MSRDQARADAPLRHAAVDRVPYITEIDNWPAYWPGLVRVEPGSRWAAPGDTATLVIRLLGREVELALTLSQLEPERLVTYTSVQQGLPDARHERHFAAAVTGSTTASSSHTSHDEVSARDLFDRLILRRAVARAMRRTIENLERELPTS